LPFLSVAAGGRRAGSRRCRYQRRLQSVAICLHKAREDFFRRRAPGAPAGQLARATRTVPPGASGPKIAALPWQPRCPGQRAYGSRAKIIGYRRRRPAGHRREARTGGGRRQQAGYFRERRPGMAGRAGAPPRRDQATGPGAPGCRREGWPDRRSSAGQAGRGRPPPGAGGLLRPDGPGALRVRSAWPGCTRAATPELTARAC
jgi:hypothetical protein